MTIQTRNSLCSKYLSLLLFVVVVGAIVLSMLIIAVKTGAVEKVKTVFIIVPRESSSCEVGTQQVFLYVLRIFSVQYHLLLNPGTVIEVQICKL